ncbi:MAG: RNA polymerase factor sigma-32 [Alphaproteobacteria bacterium]
MSSSLVVSSSKNNLPVLVEENSLGFYLEQIKKIPLLSAEKEQELLTSYKESDDVNAAQQIVVSHLRLAAKMAFGYRHYGLNIADLISEANLGLMQALKSFDLSKAVRFSTYAMWWIKASLNDFVLKSWSLVKLGTKVAHKKLFYNLNKIKAKLGLYHKKSLEDSDIAEIAYRLNVTEAEVIEMNARINGDTSLNTKIGNEDDLELMDTLVDGKANLENKFIAKEEAINKSKLVYSALKQLNEREQFIIKKRMLMDNPATLEELGAELNVSRERVRQIEKKAFEKLSEIIKNKKEA